MQLVVIGDFFFFFFFPFSFASARARAVNNGTNNKRAAPQQVSQSACSRRSPLAWASSFDSCVFARARAAPSDYLCQSNTNLTCLPDSFLRDLFLFAVVVSSVSVLTLLESSWAISRLAQAFDTTNTYTFLLRRLGATATA